jgi:NAD-dependent SIR2 family protein deacetylase
LFGLRIDEGDAMKKRCNKCQQEKPMELFYFNENRKQFAPTCKVCVRQRARERRIVEKTKPAKVHEYADSVMSDLNGGDY